jgi:glycosyltransferase involved in cell wall biosynthesis
MRKVLMFTYPRWCFGAIHNALSKELYKYGIHCDLLDWGQAYSRKEFELLNEIYDVFLTTPEAVEVLHSTYGVPYEKIYSIAHGEQDILLTKRDNGLEIFDKIGRYGVVSEVLKNSSGKFEVKRVPDVVTVGVHFDMFYQEPSKTLCKVGYAGAREVKNFYGIEIKRGHHVKETLQHTPYLNLIEHQFFHYTCMPAYYNSIDALVVSSIEESAGLPFMEASCAGRLPFTTPVGYANEFGKSSGHIELPISNKDFCGVLKNKLTYYHINDDQYVKKCKQVQEFARENYDWSKHIELWVEFLS